MVAWMGSGIGLYLWLCLFPVLLGASVAFSIWLWKRDGEE